MIYWITAKRGYILLAFLFLSFSPVVAQRVIPRAGTHFTFAILEGADRSSVVNPITSQLFLTIVSNYSGCGVIISPNGYSRNFIFRADSVSTIQLDNDLMLLRDLGKTNKGLLVSTSQPVNCTFHDYIPAAGDATQLYPDEAMDTSYIVANWGLSNDTRDFEDNRSEFVVAAINDNTQVTITPSVQTLLNQPAHQSFTFSLNRGECYIVKADTTSQPTATSLSGSIVKSSKPVSCIAGITCAYVPHVTIQSCNEIMDELLPKSAWGTHFFYVPLGSGSKREEVLVTSDVQNFTITANGFANTSSTGRAALLLSNPAELISDVPVQIHILSRGSDLGRQALTDPTMVSLLSIDQFTNTLLWNSPDFTFANYVSVTFPMGLEKQVKLDGTPIDQVGTPQQIGTSTMSAELIGIYPGLHKLTSPQPIGVTVDGFQQADAYSFVPGTIGAKINYAPVQHSLSITTDSVSECQDFQVKVNLDRPLAASEAISSIRIVVTLDTTHIRFIGILPLNLLQQNSFTVDSANKNRLVITITGHPLLTSGTDVVRLLFHALTLGGTTSVTASINGSNFNGPCEVNFGTFGPYTSTFSIAPRQDSAKAALALSSSRALLSKADTAFVSLVSIAPNAELNSIKLHLHYDHNVLTLKNALLDPSLQSAWKLQVLPSSDPATDELLLTSSTDMLTKPQRLIELNFDSFVSDSSNITIDLSSDLTSARVCPLTVLAPATSATFFGYDTCSTSILRNALNKTTPILDWVVPNPSTGDLHVRLRSKLQGNLRIDLSDELGKMVYRTDESIQSAEQIFHLHLPSIIPSGNYIFRLELAGQIQSRKISLVR